MKTWLLTTFAAGWLILSAAGPSAADDNPLGGMVLLDGYKHEVLQGIDSLVGKISKPNGLEFTYEIGHVPQPGAPRFGGSFSDRPKNTPADQVRWYQKQTVNGQPVHLAHLKNDTLLVSFPKKGMNVHVVVRSADEMAQALLMLLTYPNPVQKPAPLKR